MPSSLPPDLTGNRRRWLGAAVALGLAAPWAVRAAPGREAGDVAELLRRGGVVLALRHALAPGTFDPPGFQLGDCRTQRNLSDEGRAQSRRLGAWLASRSLQPVQVRSSPWCRCVDTATLAFGRAEVWPALGSPVDSDAAARNAQGVALRQALVAATRRSGAFEVWVTHNFVLGDLAGAGTDSGDGLLLRADARGQPEVLARWAAP
jgi:phosphohistidine phosphatase SixA